MAVEVIDKSSDKNELAFFQDVVRRTESAGHRVAVDCEGVNLGRYGSVEIVSLCFELQSKHTFLIDFQDGTSSNEAKMATKRLLENPVVLKIIHDCRMDCDALYHIHRIEMFNVHDTSVYHHSITGLENVSLNSTLSGNGLNVNTTRDNSVYERNYKFWATRPLNTTMKAWASADVSNLLELSTIQIQRISAAHRAAADAKSALFTKVLVESHVHEATCEIPIGLFIGKRGCNLRSLQSRTSTKLYQKRGNDSRIFLVYHKDDQSLHAVQAAMRGYYL